MRHTPHEWLRLCESSQGTAGSSRSASQPKSIHGWNRRPCFWGDLSRPYTNKRIDPVATLREQRRFHLCLKVIISAQR